MSIYICFFPIKVLPRIGFWGRSLLVLWTAACISSTFLNEDTLSTEVLWHVVYLVKKSLFFFPLFFQASCFFASMPASVDSNLCQLLTHPRSALVILSVLVFCPFFFSFFLCFCCWTHPLPAPLSSSSSSSSVVVRLSCTKRPYVCLVASSKTLIQLFV